MDQLKIGKFIAECRKKNKLTQMQLAEKLNITDRAVSKWENGRALPDSAIMLELCDVLQITVNDLLNGEVVSVENYNRKMQEQLLEMVKQKEMADKRLLMLRRILCVQVYFIVTWSLVYLFQQQLPFWLIRFFWIACGINAICVAFFCVNITRMAGYYRCKKCGHIHTPTYQAMLASMDISRWAYLRCPECGKKSWHERVFHKD